MTKAKFDMLLGAVRGAIASLRGCALHERANESAILRRLRDELAETRAPRSAQRSVSFLLAHADEVLAALR